MRTETFKKAFEAFFRVRRRTQSRLMRRRTEMQERDQTGDGIHDLIDLVD